LDVHRPVIGRHGHILGIARRLVDAGPRGAREALARGGVDAHVEIGLVGHHTSTSANGAAGSSTGKRRPRPVARSAIAAVTSTCDGIARRGTITLTRVVIVWSPNRNALLGADCGRSASACSRVPKNSAWLGHTVAHIGFLPTD